ncbi:aconitase family protein, partial [Bacillus sp. D-CC]
GAIFEIVAPEYGATCGFFPIDDISLEYLRLTGRDEEQIRVVEEYCKANGLFYTADSKDPIYTDLVEIVARSAKGMLFSTLPK